jgi:hypothetical protein
VTATTSSRNSSSMQIDAKLKFFYASADRRLMCIVSFWVREGGRHEGLSQKSSAALVRHILYWHSDDLR